MGPSAHIITNTPLIQRPTSSNPATPASQQPPESAELTNEPQQQEQGCRGLISSVHSARLSSQDLTPLAMLDQRDYLAVIWCALYLLVTSKRCPPQLLSLSPSQKTSLPPPLLPLKKRSKDWKYWTQASSSTSRP